MKKNLLYITTTAIGIALFVVLALVLQVPVFQNYYLCLGYIAMIVFCYLFGTVSGTLVGVFGVILYCLLTSGLRGMPGWSLGNLFIGIGMGLTFLFTKKISKRYIQYILWIVSAIIFTAIGILGAKSLIDSLIKAQPFILRVSMNIYAFIADVIVIIISLPICILLKKPAHSLLSKIKTN